MVRTLFSIVVLLCIYSFLGVCLIVFGIIDFILCVVVFIEGWVSSFIRCVLWLKRESCKASLAVCLELNTTGIEIIVLSVSLLGVGVVIGHYMRR